MAQTTLQSALATIMLCSGLVICAPCFSDQARASEPDPSITKTYSEGQLITLSATVNKAGDEAAAIRADYFKRVFPIARDFGLSRDFSLRITETVVGDFEPGGLSFFSWPSAEAENRLSEHPDWPEIKKLRPQGWDELRLYSTVLQDDLVLNFDSGKFYTVAVAWIDPDHPDAYDLYLDNVEATLADLNARYLYKMRMPRFEQHATPGPAPGQVTFVEWETREGLDRFLKSDGFKTHSPSLVQGTTRFELHRIEPVIAD